MEFFIGKKVISLLEQLLSGKEESSERTRDVAVLIVSRVCVKHREHPDSSRVETTQDKGNREHSNSSSEMALPKHWQKLSNTQYIPQGTMNNEHRSRTG